MEKEEVEGNLKVQNSNKKLSIIIPAYNAEKTIISTLESIDRSVLNPCEIIVVNDCSTDATAEIVDNYKSTKHKISLTNMTTNSGPGICRDCGLQISNEPWVLFFDADDELVPGVIDDAIDCLYNESIDVGLFPYKVRNFSSEGGRLMDMWEIDQEIFYSHGEAIVNPSIEPEIIQITNYPWNKICKRDYLDKIKIGFGTFRINEDIYPHWQILTQVSRVRFFVRHMVRYTISSQGHASNINNYQRFQLIDVLIATKRFLDTLDNGYLFKPVFFRFAQIVLCWAYDLLSDGYRIEFKNYAKRFVYSLDERDLGAVNMSGDSVVDYLCWIMQ